MVSNKITEGVGKKIVEALKQQSDIEIQNVVDNAVPPQEETDVQFSNDIDYNDHFDDINDDVNDDVNDYQQDIDFSEHNETPVMPNITNQNTISFSPNTQQESFSNDLDGFEIPTNIAVLKQLINQLPAGVSKQTGAQIIKQTMEALGISMKSVLQEAQQVQESLNNSSRECQASIMEYKKQISVLEKQAQKYQRQYSSLNDIISLFIQTNI